MTQAKEYLNSKSPKGGGNGSTTTAVAKKEQTSVAIPKTFLQSSSTSIANVLENWEPLFRKALPKAIGITSQNMIVWMTNLILGDQKLKECTVESIVGCALATSVFGLNPDKTLGNIYYIPRKNGKTGQVEMTWIMGYQGEIALMRRNKQVKAIYAYVVGENDEYEIKLGDEPRIFHKPNPVDPGNPILTYAVVEFKDGTKIFRYLNKKQVMARKNKSEAKGSNYSPWNTDFEDEMWMKTAIRNIQKWVPYGEGDQRELVESFEDKVLTPDMFDNQAGSFDRIKVEQANKNIQLDDDVEDIEPVEEKTAKSPEPPLPEEPAKTAQTSDNPAQKPDKPVELTAKTDETQVKTPETPAKTVEKPTGELPFVPDEPLVKADQPSPRTKAFLEKWNQYTTWFSELSDPYKKEGLDEMTKIMGSAGCTMVDEILPVNYSGVEAELAEVARGINERIKGL